MLNKLIIVPGLNHLIRSNKMKYLYENLNSDDFETLIVLLCQNLLGISVQGFTKGPDGGRDAKFMGTAEIFPSRAQTWVGTVIIQAKHTNGYNKSFSDSDFFSETGKTNVIAKEILKIQKLRKDCNLDHYMLFSNRKLPANAETNIQKFISERCDIPQTSIYLCGVDQLELWLKKFPEVPKNADIDPVDSPLIVSPEELAEVIEALVDNKDSLGKVMDDPPSPRIPYEKKNTINNMTSQYAKRMRKLYLKETSAIRNFLWMPENSELLQMYETVVNEFQLKITAKRRIHQTFDDILEYIADLLFNRDVVLRKNKRLTRTMLFFFY